MKQMAFLTQILNRAQKSMLGIRLTNLRVLFACLMSVSFWITACNPSGSTQNYYNTTQNPAGSPGQTSMSGGGGATGDGGGGQGVQCGDTSNPNIRNKVLVRDIYEAVINSSLKMKTIPGPNGKSGEVSSEAIKVLVQSVKNYFGPASRNLPFTSESFWMDFTKNISFLDEDRVLHPSQDANSPIALQKECKIVQIAYWDESPGKAEDGTLYVNRKLWNELDQLNKIGLLAHEFFFKQARQAQYKNSDTVRSKVGLLLSEEGLKPLFTSWVPSSDSRVGDILPASRNGFKYCEGTTSEDPSAKLQLYQYEGEDKKQHFVFPVISSTSINSALLFGNSFSFVAKDDENLAGATDLLIYQSWFARTNFYSLYKELKRPDIQETWFERYYMNSGLISKEFEFGSYDTNFQQLFEDMMKQKRVIWTNYLQSSPSLISLYLLNPTEGWIPPEDLKLKSKQDLISTIQEEIQAAVSVCDIPTKREKGLTAELMKEISDTIRAGEYPSQFLIWTSSLKEFDASYKDVTTENESEPCTLSKNSKLRKQLPMLLYKVITDTYGRKDVDDTLGTLGFEKQKKSEMTRGRISVSSGSSSLTFELDCKDYIELFTDVTKSKERAEPQMQAYDKTVVNKFTEYPKIKTEPEAAVDIQKFSEFLKFPSTWESGFFAQYLHAHRVKCHAPINVFTLSCEFMEDFMRDLGKEKKITVTACDLNTTQEYEFRGNEPKRESQCVIVKMETENNSYVVNFNYNIREDVPELEFIRRVPNH